MRGIIVRLLINALGIWLAAQLLPGIQLEGGGTLILAAVLMALVNAIVRPLAVLLTLPLTILTLGLFLLVINAAMLGLVAALLPGFEISGFFSALFGWLIISLTSWLTSSFIGPNGDYDVIVVRRYGKG